MRAARDQRARRRAVDERGAAIVEFALVVPLFLFILFGLIAFGLMLALKQSVTQSAEEGARASIGVFLPAGATQAMEEAEREQRAFAAAKDGLEWLGDKCCKSPDGRFAGEDPGASITIDPNVIECPNAPGVDCMRVRVSYPYRERPLVPLPSSVPPFSFAVPETIASEATIQLGT